MRIAIFGSRKMESEWPILGSEDEFIEAARDIGQQLAHLGHAILVGGISQRTADVHVVDGFLSVAASNRSSKARIEVVRPAGRERGYDEQYRKAPHLFEFHSPEEGWWEGAHLFSLRQCDAVVTLGGNKGTYLAGLATTVCGKRIAPIGSFGGASKELSKVSTAARPDLAQAFRRLNAPWSSDTRDVALDLVRATGGPQLLIIHGRSKDWLDLKDWLHHEAGINRVSVMMQEYGGGRTLPEKFEALGRNVDAAVALATADDVGGLAGESPDRNLRARQNVWIEVGYIWGKLGRGRVIVLKHPNVEIPSDLQGVEHFTYTDGPREHAENLRKFLQAIS